LAFTLTDLGARFPERRFVLDSFTTIRVTPPLDWSEVDAFSDARAADGSASASSAATIGSGNLLSRRIRMLPAILTCGWWRGNPWQRIDTRPPHTESPRSRSSG
jgi:hypothetical protein